MFFSLALLTAFVSVGRGQWRGTPMIEDVTGLTTRGPYLFASTFGSGVYRTTDDNTWTKVNTGFTSYEGYIWIYGIAAGAQALFARADQGTYRSTDDGTTWTLALPGLAACAWASGHDVVVGSPGAIDISTDDGEHWTHRRVPMDTLSSVTAAWLKGSTILVGTVGDGAFSSTDMGLTWTSRNAGLPRYNDGSYVTVASMVSFRKDVVLSTYGKGAVFISRDTAYAWTPLNTGISGYANFKLFGVDSTLFAGSRGMGNHGAILADNGIFMCSDTAAGWASVSTLSRPYVVDDMAARNGNIYMAVGTTDESGLSATGVWKRPLAEMMPSVASVNDMDFHLRLWQNYPNPFNGTTVVEYELFEGSPVVLELFNILGERVRTLAAGVQEVGRHQFRLDAAGLPGGLYVCRVTTERSIQSLKVVLVR